MYKIHPHSKNAHPAMLVSWTPLPVLERTLQGQFAEKTLDPEERDTQIASNTLSVHMKQVSEKQPLPFGAP